MSTDASAAEPLILARRTGALTRIVLNRPRAINALSHEMFRGLRIALDRAFSDGSTAILLEGAGERGFCGGGDVKEISSGDASSILRDEYRVDLAIGTAPIPVIGFMDGITMGGGIGLTGHARHRIVTERSRLAMPEARIGLAPDVGGHLLLSRAPGRLGELLAVTAGEMTAGDAIALGFADDFVPSERLGPLGEALAAGEAPESAIARFSAPAPDSALLADRTWWDPLAEAALGGSGPAAPAASAGSDASRAVAPASEDPAGAAIRLLSALERSGDPRAHRVAGVVRGMCPCSVAVTLAQIDRTRRLALTLPEVLGDDLRVASRMCARPDFAEGVRAQLIDKDRAPHWRPERIETLGSAELLAVLGPLGPDEDRLRL